MPAPKDIGHVDAALQKLGPFRKYTIIQFSMHILSQFAVATHILSIVFTGQKNPFRCPAPHTNNETYLDHLASNSSLVNASQPVYDSICHTVLSISSNNISHCKAQDVEFELPKNLYFVSEFDLVCEKEFFAGLTQTLLTMGHAIGSLVFPYFADNYGRKPVLLLCSFMWLGTALGVAFSINYTMLAACKTFAGIFLQGVAQTAVSMMLEILTGRQRGQMFGSLAFIFWTLSIMMMVPIAYLLKDYTWRYLELAYCSYFVYILLYVLLMDESLRWLAANGLKERVMDILKKASRWNGSNLDEVIAVFYKGNETELTKNEKVLVLEPIDVNLQTENSVEKCKDNLSQDSKEIEEKKGANKNTDITNDNLNCLSLIRNRMLRNSTLFSMMSWFFNSLTYYALFLMSSTLSGSLYLNYFLNSVVEIPSAIFIYFFIDRLGRKVCFAAFSITSGVSLIAAATVSALIAEEKIAIKVLTILGKFGISGSYGVIYTYTPELFPTNVRTTGLGLANMCACVGGMLAPFAELLMKSAIYAPGLIFGISSLVLSIWVYFLPETARRQLPQSVNDIKEWSLEQTTKKKGSAISDTAEENVHDNSGFTC